MTNPCLPGTFRISVTATQSDEYRFNNIYAQAPVTLHAEFRIKGLDRAAILYQP